MSVDRLPPHSIEAEEGVLGCILWLPEKSMTACLDRIDSESFYDIRNRAVFDAMCDLMREGRVIDHITVVGAMKASKLVQIEWLELLDKYENATPSAANLPYYLDIMVEKATLRKILHLCTETAIEVYEHGGDTEAFLDGFEKQALAVRPRRGLESLVSVKDLVRSALEDIEAVWNRQGAVEGISTGFPDLDKVTGGLKESEMTVVAGYPGAGKTSFAMNMAEHAMLKESRKVGIFSLEMSGVSLVKRFICSHAKVSLRNISNGYLAQNDFPKMATAAGDISKSAIWFDDSSELSIHSLRSKARRMRQEHGVELIVVDYLQLLNANGGNRKIESRQQEVTDISRGMKGIAKELSIPFVALSQLNDDGKLRESRSIGQDADNVWVLKEDADQAEHATGAREVKLRVVKNRNGPRNYDVNLTFLSEFTRFESAAKISDCDVPTDSKKPYYD